MFDAGPRISDHVSATTPGVTLLPKHIGMVGVGSIGSSLCYRQLFRLAYQQLPPDQHPTLSIHNLPLSRYLEAVERDDWHQVASLLRQSTETLASIGAELCFTPDNMVQHALQLVTHGSPVPWVSMAEIVAEAVARDSRQRVGIIGTPIVTSGSTYQTHLGVRGVRICKPSAEDTERMRQITLTELAYGFISETSLKHLRQAVDRMGEGGCDAVIFGCSESPLLSEHAGWSLPTYDSCQLVAAEVLRRACDPAPVSLSR